MGNCLKLLFRPPDQSSKAGKYRLSTPKPVTPNVDEAVIMKKLNPKDFMFSRQSNQPWLYKAPGSCNGQADFIVEECQKSTIVIKDHITQCSIDLCTGCLIMVAVCEGSCFIRDCRDCTVVVACGQLRMRDCQRVRVFTLAGSQPVIESSSQVQFGCYPAGDLLFQPPAQPTSSSAVVSAVAANRESYLIGYKEWPTHLLKAQLNMWDNEWWDVHDFTKTPGRPNFSLLSAKQVSDCFQKCGDSNAMISEAEEAYDHVDAHRRPCCPQTLGALTRGLGFIFVLIAQAGGDAEIADFCHRHIHEGNGLFLNRTRPVYPDMLKQFASTTSHIPVDMAERLKRISSGYAVALKINSASGKYENLFGFLKEFLLDHSEAAVYHSPDEQQSQRESQMLFKTREY